MGEVHWLGMKDRRVRFNEQRRPRPRPMLWWLLFSLVLDALVIWALLSLAARAGWL